MISGGVSMSTSTVRESNTPEIVRTTRHNRAEQNTGAKTAPHAHLVAGAEKLGRDNGKPRSHAHDKAQDQKQQAAGAAHARQGRDPDGPPHDQGIGHIVDLLEKIADKERAARRKKSASPGCPESDF